MSTQISIQSSTALQTSIFKSKSEEKSLYQKLREKESKIGLVGLGYVGLPIALEFAKSFSVVGYDINKDRVDLMHNNVDPSGELESSEFLNKDISFTSSYTDLASTDVIVVAVPTPVGKDNAPNLKPLSMACKDIGEVLSRGKMVIFESTVYPGCTEEVCIPILEEVSGLKCNTDFWVGYSPERINPGDKVHTLTQITKIVSASNAYAETEIYKIYDHIIDAGIHVAPSIKVAEAAKIVENTQRDVNIALMNELSTLFASLDINTHEVLEAAGTKWNFLNFYPGLVGGHCIGVDPYYLIHKAKSIGTDLEVISSSRRINDAMPQNVVDQVQNALEDCGKSLESAKVLVLGATFKEDVTDLRNSKASEMCQILKSSAKSLDIVDPFADPKEMKSYYGLDLVDRMDENYDVIIYAVNHKEFATINWEFIETIKSEKAVVFDFKKCLGYPSDKSGNTSYLTL